MRRTFNSVDFVGNQHYVFNIKGNETQYEWAEKRVEELLPKVNDDTPVDDPAYIELVRNFHPPVS